MTDHFNTQQTIEIELAPIEDARQLKSAGADSQWQTVRGKKNRIAIGAPIWVKETEVSEDGLLSTQDLQAFPSDTHDFYRLNLALTLLPDLNCRFRHADLIVRCSNHGNVGDAPVIRSLMPKEVASQKVRTVQTGKANSFDLKGPAVFNVAVKLGENETDTAQFDQLMINVSSFGIGTSEAGWRFALTDSRAIPLGTSDLSLLLAKPKEAQSQVEVSVIAQIEVLTTIDKWLTLMFGKKAGPGASLRFDLPAPSEA